VVDLDKTALYDPLRDIVAVGTFCADHPGTTVVAPEEMTRKTYNTIYVEVFIPFEMAVACAARDSYPPNLFRYVIIVRKPDTSVIDVL
jgi:hypothetical protein